MIFKIVPPMRKCSMMMMMSYYLFRSAIVISTILIIVVVYRSVDANNKEATPTTSYYRQLDPKSTNNNTIITTNDDVRIRNDRYPSIFEAILFSSSTSLSRSLSSSLHSSSSLFHDAANDGKEDDNDDKQLFSNNNTKQQQQQQQQYPIIQNRFLQSNNNSNTRNSNVGVTLPLRINCGSSQSIIDTVGNIWLPDQYYIQGMTRNRCRRTIVNNKPLPAVYCSNRYGSNFSYYIPISYVGGDLNVTFYFANLLSSFLQQQQQQPTFTITIGQYGTKINSKDIIAQSNRMGIASVIVPSPTSSSGGTLQIIATASTNSGYAMINGIQIIGIPPRIVAPPLPTIRINCGSLIDYKDRNGIVWTADTKYMYGSSDVYTVCEKNRTKFDSLEPVTCSERFFYTTNLSNTVKDGGYRIPISVAGKYRIRLLFTELYYNTNSQRIFSVFLQRRKILSNYDLYRAKGAANVTTVITRYVTLQKPGGITIRFVNIRQHAKINGIEITGASTPEYQLPLSTTIIPAPSSPSTVVIQPVASPTIAPVITPTNIKPTLKPITVKPVVANSTKPITSNKIATTPLRINAGSDTTYTARGGVIWEPDQYYINGGTYSSCDVFPPSVVRKPLFCTERSASDSSSSLSYEIPFAFGTYEITLYFAEIYFNEPNQRVFDIAIQGQIVLSKLDIYAKVGFKKPFLYTSTAIVNSNTPTLKIDFINSIQNAKVSAIEIIKVRSGPNQPVSSPGIVNTRKPTSTPSAIVTKPIDDGGSSGLLKAPIRINAGCNITWTDPKSKTVWLPDQYYQGGWNYGTNLCNNSIDGTELDTLLCTERFFGGPANTTVGKYIIPLRSGMYVLKILFSEIFFTAVGQRIFSVIVQGKVANANLDIVNAVGSNNALILSRSVVVGPNDTGLTIEFQNVIENAKINAFEILDYGSDGALS